MSKSRITTNAKPEKTNMSHVSNTHFIHPGIILQEEYLDAMGLTQTRVAKSTGIPQSRLSEICAGRRGITADTALRLGKFFDVEPQGFLNLQNHYDLEEAAAVLRAAKPPMRIRAFNPAVAAHPRAPSSRPRALA
jgi:addiction module HigA family antidote